MTAITWQKIEGGLIAAAALAIAVMMGGGWPWWLWLVIFLAPDLTMAGYLFGPRIGATVYNLGHLYACGFLLVVLGMVTGQGGLISVGLMWIAHVGVDRAVGYGLKEPEGFGVTHLGKIGKDRD